MPTDPLSASASTTPPSGRILWSALEAVHSVTYFAAEARAAHEEIGLRGFWRGYFAMRAAPLGAVDAPVVEALFAGFAPAMVARALPSVWALATPAQALAVRSEGAVAALRAHGPDEAGLTGVLPVLRRVVAAAPTAGRALGAANAALPEPAGPLAATWWAATAIRESRGDGHVAVLTAEGLDGLLAHALRAAAEGNRTRLQEARGYGDTDWAAAGDVLRSRGLLAAGGAITAEGTALRAHVEARTDALAERAWAETTEPERRAVAAAVTPLALRVADATVPYPSPVGAPHPSPGPHW